MNEAKQEANAEYVDTGRLEAFSDGVFAVAITLLVLDIHVPNGAPGKLLEDLGNLWTNYLSFFASFLTIGVIWINHHNTYKIIKHADHMLLVLNTFLLMVVVAIPFPTALVAEYIKPGHPHQDQLVATMVFAGTWVVLGAIFNVLWRYATYNMRLVGKDVSPELVKAATTQYNTGVLFYIVAFALAFISIETSLVAILLLALVFALPSFGTGGRKRRTIAQQPRQNIERKDTSSTLAQPAEVDSSSDEAATGT